jgi:ribose/xylose/arabinose/galactoside ABC-type transport system permease subunit
MRTGTRPRGDPAITTTTPAPRAAAGWWTRREAALCFALVALVAAVSAARPDFLTPENLRGILEQAAPYAVAAAGMTALIVAGGIDISIGSILAVCAVAVALLVKQGWPLPVAAAGAVLAGAVLGGVNGLLVARFKIPPIVATLATMGGLRGLMVWATGGNWVRELPPSFNWLYVHRPLGLPLTVWIAALVVAGMALFLARTPAGRQCYAVGSHARSAELSGVRVGWVMFRSFVMLGALVGLSAVLYVAPFSFVQTDAGQGFELAVITAVVIGGTNIFGGQGTVLGSALGVLLLGVIRPGLVYLQTLTGLKAEWGPAVQGALILAAVLWDSAARREAARLEG